jgi:hypothetical protein
VSGVCAGALIIVGGRAGGDGPAFMAVPVLMLPVVLVPIGHWSLLLSLSAATSLLAPSAHPGAVARRAGGGCWAVPRRRGALVFVFIIVGWLSVVAVGHKVCCFWGRHL